MEGVDLEEIRKYVQCPICLGTCSSAQSIYLTLHKLPLDCSYIVNFFFIIAGIIRKTRTFMECLHRFCQVCIDKSMRSAYGFLFTCLISIIIV